MEEFYIYIYYMNDEKHPMRVQINHTFIFDPNDPCKQPNIEYVTLQPTEGRIFRVEAVEGSIPYVKKWDKVVLLTYMDPRSVAELDLPSSNT